MNRETSMSMIEPVDNTVVISSECGIPSQEDVKNVQGKRCHKCGRVLPLEDFNKCSRTKDGLQNHCRECQALYMKDYHVKKARKIQLGSPVKNDAGKEASLHKVYAHPGLSSFTNRQLMEELKARGFRWDYMLEPKKKIYFDKI